MLDLGNEMFPMIIRGSLRFINVFMYSWSDTRNEIARSFVLSDNPQILFGMDYKDEDLITTISVSYTHLDVYKRQLQWWGLHL